MANGILLTSSVSGVYVPGVPFSQYGEANAVVFGSETTILTYTVPPNLKLRLAMIEYDGTNIAEFKVKIDSVVQAKRRTYFSGPLSGEFIFPEGLTLLSGQVIVLTVLHSRPSSGDFAARLTGLLQ